MSWIILTLVTFASIGALSTTWVCYFKWRRTEEKLVRALKFWESMTASPGRKRYVVFKWKNGWVSRELEYEALLPFLMSEEVFEVWIEKVDIDAGDVVNIKI